MSDEEKKAIDNFKKLDFFEYDWQIRDEDFETREDMLSYAEKMQKIILHLVEKQQERIEECYHKGVIDGRISMRYYIQDKIREYFEQDIAFKKRLQREKQKIDKYNKGKFDTIENILEFLHVNIKEENS